MKTFKVYKTSNNELVTTYFAEVQQDIFGYNANEIYQVEQSDEQIFLEQKLEKEKEVKEILKAKLRETDWSQLSDCFLTAQNVVQFQVYRSELRNQLEVADENPWNVVFPVIPEEIKQPI